MHYEFKLVLTCTGLAERMSTRIRAWLLDWVIQPNSSRTAESAALAICVG